MCQVLGSNWLAIWSDATQDMNDSSPCAQSISYRYLETYSWFQLGGALCTVFSLTNVMFGALQVRVL